MGKKARKAKKGKRASKTGGDEGRISIEAIRKGTGLDKISAKAVSNNIWRIGKNNNYGEVVVVTLDIRKSSIALVNLEDFEEYSNVITDYVCYVLKTCQSNNFPCKVDFTNKDGTITPQENGWFDKFTGDGVIAFWRLPREPEYDEKYYDLPQKTSYKQKLEYYNKKWNETIRGAIEFSNLVTEQFLENVMPDIKKTCGLLPADFGISVGIDAGECLLTELKTSDKFQERCRRFGLECKGKANVSLNVTAIGRAIIGATRMVSKAKPYEILINSYPGSKLKAALGDPEDKLGQGIKFSMEPTYVSTKECKLVEAYRVVSWRLEQLKKAKTFCGLKKDTPEDEDKQISKYKNGETETEDDG